MKATFINYQDTGHFSPSVIKYLNNDPELRSFFTYSPDINGFAELLKNKNVIANRETLVSLLNKQYSFENKSEAEVFAPGAGGDLKGAEKSISLLRLENTYTITTGHQLNIFAGPLYFIYKIVTAIKLSRQLKEAFPDKNFVPVYWMASEDHDFA